MKLVKPAAKTIKRSDHLVTSNKYVDAHYNLNAHEEKIIACAMVIAREYKHESPLTHETFIELKGTEYAKLVNMDERSAYAALRRASESLLSQRIKFFEPDPETGAPSRLDVPITNGVRYVDGLGIIRLRFSKEVIPYFTQLVDGIAFTRHEIGYLLALNSPYAIRLYRIFHKELFKKSPIELDLPYLRQLFNLGDKYEVIANFKSRVLDVAVDQINTYTDLSVQYELMKRNKGVVTGIRFFVARKSDVVEYNVSAIPMPPKERRKRLSTQEKNEAKMAELQAKGFDKDESELFLTIRAKHPEITREFVIGMAIQKKFSVLQTLATLNAEYQSSDDFSLSSDQQVSDSKNTKKSPTIDSKPRNVMEWSKEAISDKRFWLKTFVESEYAINYRAKNELIASGINLKLLFEMHNTKVVVANEKFKHAFESWLVETNV